MAIIDDRQDGLLNFLCPYLLQMQCEYKVYKKHMLQDEILNYKPEIIIYFWSKCCSALTLYSYYKEKNVIIIFINDNYQIKECDIPLLEIEMYNVTSKQSNIVYSNNPEQCRKEVTNLNQYAMIRIQ